MRIFILCLLLQASSSLAQVTTPKLGDFPELRIQVMAGTGRRAVEGSSYKKTMQITPKVVIEGASKMLPIPAGEVTMVTVSMDTRAKYVDRKEQYQVASSETLPMPAVATGDRREFSFTPPVLTFDADRDRSNVGGQVFKFFICGVRDPATRSLLFFQTTNLQLENFCKANPEKREQFLKMSKGTTFTDEFK